MYYKELGLDSPIVNFNGSYVHHPLDRSFDVFHSALDLSIAKEIVHGKESMIKGKELDRMFAMADDFLGEMAKLVDKLIDEKGSQLKA